MKKLKQPGDNISIKTKKNEAPAVMEWINSQSNLVDSIRYLIENEIRMNGVRNLQHVIPSHRPDPIPGEALEAARMHSQRPATAVGYYGDGTVASGNRNNAEDDSRESTQADRFREDAQADFYRDGVRADGYRGYREGTRPEDYRESRQVDGDREHASIHGYREIAAASETGGFAMDANLSDPSPSDSRFSNSQNHKQVVVTPGITESYAHQQAGEKSRGANAPSNEDKPFSETQRESSVPAQANQPFNETPGGVSGPTQANQSFSQTPMDSGTQANPEEQYGDNSGSTQQSADSQHLNRKRTNDHPVLADEPDPKDEDKSAIAEEDDIDEDDIKSWL